MPSSPNGCLLYSLFEKGSVYQGGGKVLPGTGMPLSGWMDEWYGGIEREFGLAVKHSSTIELQCPPEHRDRDGLWQKIREVRY